MGLPARDLLTATGDTLDATPRLVAMSDRRQARGRLAAGGVCLPDDVIMGPDAAPRRADDTVVFPVGTWHPRGR